MASTEVEHHVPDTGWRREPNDIPSARFGWSGEGHRTFQMAAVLGALSLLGMLVGNHIGHVEDLYLIGFAGLLLLTVIIDTVAKRGKWRN